jgi:arabinogalactan endo-1,4-beta-galactosidase
MSIYNYIYFSILLMKKTISLILVFIFFSCSKNKETDSIIVPSLEEEFYKGMDLSFQSELENYPLVYKDENNKPISILPYVKSKGCNLVRIKIWHTPANGQNTLAQVKAYALKVKQNNMKFMLDFHYSDTWADPSHQSPPIAWQNLTQIEVKNQIYLYTKDVLTQLKNQGTIPDFVQIGNETDSGFLWNYGKVWDTFDNNWGNYSDLIKKGIEAVREINGDKTKVILHNSSVENSLYFFDKLQPYNLDFNVIGLSYYPQFQTKDLNLVQTKLNTLSSRFNKEIMLVEVAYPFTLGYNDNSNNFIGQSNQIIPEYPATPQGQKDYLLRLTSILKSIPNDKGIGFVYWAPDWVAFSGNNATSTTGSSWENQCLWDFNLKSLPAFEAFKQ